jgi:gliding motility-associated-like protein
VYTVNVSDNSFGQNCSAEFTAALQVMPQPTTAFEFSLHPCGGQVDFTDGSYEDIVTWSWNFSGAGSSSMQHPTFYFEQGGAQTVTLVTTNIHGCSSSRIRGLEVADAEPTVSGSVNICIGQSAEMTAGGGYEYAWKPEETVTHPYLPKTTVTPTVSTTYSVIITTGRTNTVTNLPCEFTLTAHVRVSELSRTMAVSASAAPTVVVKGNGTTLVYVGDPGAEVSWLPPKSTTPATGYTVTARPDKPTTYTAVARREACVTSIPVPVDVYSNLCLGSEIFIPNTFTPNGDGSNDLFRVRGLSVDEVYFAVFNRWGEKVFETSDKTGGWDGRYEGKDVDVGVFGWYLKVKCFNGEESFLKGNVTLLR